jgi:8-oxo-dGTP pyrophosphatase MutT (NUDIX family)
MDALRARLTDPANDGLWFRPHLMPRWRSGDSARPLAPPPDAPPPRPGAVLILFYPHNNAVYLPLTVRTASLRDHSGEVSLPGGSYDAADGDLSQTALREAWEELGIVASAVTIWGRLTPVWIPVSNFEITPFVGWIDERPVFQPAPAEVATVIEAPLDLLLQPATIQREERDLRGARVLVPFFALDEHKVWGATALVLAEVVGKLVDRGN